MDSCDVLTNALQRYSSLLCAFTEVDKSCIGGFVWTGDSYGIGKLLSLKGQTARVSFFHSITETEDQTYVVSRLGRARLSPQTRVYVHDEQTDLWRVGRVAWRFEEDGRLWYEVLFPNKVSGRFPEKMLQVRCLHPKVDPTDVLAHGGMETQFFHDRRWAAVESLVDMRGACRGLTGLISSSIELVPHQVEVVRRVLEDPVQRYLLADEVGLGKTIEAGVIVRQRLLDDPDSSVLVLTPSTLVRQWRRELDEKFHVHEFPDSVVVVPFEALPVLEEDGYDMLVIDETHLLVGKSGVSDPSFAHIAKIAHSSQSLLLVSATPVVGDEDATHALLHLLDPITFGLEDRQAVGERISRRQEYGRRLLALSPTLPPPLLNQAIMQIERTFPGDAVLKDLVKKIRKSESDVGQGIVALKKHIAETYRLHQRLLRTRRRDLEGWELLPRKSSLVMEVGFDDRLEAILDALENWRYASRLVLGAPEQQSPCSPLGRERRLAVRYAALIDALGCGVEQFRTELGRQERMVAAGKASSFVGEDQLMAALQDVALAESKALEVAQELTSFAGYRPHVGFQVTPRVSLATQAITLMIRGMRRDLETPKLVAFSSSTGLARRLYECMLAINGKGAVFGAFEGMTLEEIDQVVDRFLRSENASVIICDQSGELGLNLHFAHGIVHLDLPLSPTRLEQRIGRVDRFGRQHEVICQRIIIPSDDDQSPWLAWLEVLRDAFRIFDASISEVQFILDRIEQEMVLSLYRHGAAGLRSMKTQIQEGLRKERERLDEQYALDRLAMGEQKATALFSGLREADENEAGLGDAFNRWLVRALQVSHKFAPHIAHNAFTYRWSDRTLAPEWPWRVILLDGLDRPQRRRYLTFHRRTAAKHPEVSLMRLGFPFVDMLERFMIWDDRGSAFATWRMDPGWQVDKRGEWLGFRLCYVIEADADKTARLLKEEIGPRLMQSVWRRAEGFLAPWTQVLHIDMNLEEVTDPDVLAILARPYSSREVSLGQRDFNLGSRQEAMSALVDPYVFAGICRDVRKRSETMVRNSTDFQRLTESISRHALGELTLRNERLKRRNEAVGLETGARDAAVELEIKINQAIISGINEPRIRLDSIGFFIIADYPPGEVLGCE